MLWRLSRPNWPAGGCFCELWCCRESQTHKKFMSLCMRVCEWSPVWPSTCVHCVIINSLLYFCLTDLSSASLVIAARDCVWAQLQFCHIVIHGLSCFHIKATQHPRGVRLGEFKAMCFCSICLSCHNCTEKDTNFAMTYWVISHFSGCRQEKQCNHRSSKSFLVNQAASLQSWAEHF